MVDTDTQQTTPASSTAEEVVPVKRTKVKIAKPDFFYGERSKLEKWILQCDRYFTIEDENIEEDHKPLIATGHMRGRAEQWVTPILKRYIDDDVTDARNVRIIED
jgi:hypothetical protein